MRNENSEGILYASSEKIHKMSKIEYVLLENFSSKGAVAVCTKVKKK